MSVLESVERDLERIAELDASLADSALAALAQQLAKELDSSGNSATSKSMCARALMDALERLQELAPSEKEKDRVDELAEKRDRRRGTAAEA